MTARINFNIDARLKNAAMKKASFALDRAQPGNT
jgi:hypothetical protein